MNENPSVSFNGSSCPLPLKHNKNIVIGHGSGGLMTHDLIQEVFQSQFRNPTLDTLNDFAKTVLPAKSFLKGHLSISTDAHIISPLFFPGGDIGRLAIAGTVNDVAMSGGIPLFITAAFIIEEGLPIDTLKRVAISMQQTAEEAEVQIVAGDTKVVEKGKADKLFISTTGIGWIPQDVNIGGEFACPGDAVIISGSLADHGIAVLAARGQLNFSTTIQSDVATLNRVIRKVLKATPNVHVLRDPTRGGLGTSLNEIAQQSQVSIVLDEEHIPIKAEVRAACELLGFDPLYVANEGKVIIILPESESKQALDTLHSDPLGVSASKIGSVISDPHHHVLLKTLIGGTRIIEMLSGEMLPRIC